MAKVTMPQLGESVAEGTIGKWLKKPGDHVDKYEPLLEVITDKVNAEVPSPFAGTLTEILVEEGATVPNNAEIAVIEEAGSAAAGAATSAAVGQTEASAAPTGGPAAPTAMAASSPKPTQASTAAPDEAREPAGSSAASAPAASTPAAVARAVTAHGPAGSDERSLEELGGSDARMTPAVRRLLREHGLSAAVIVGTGGGGRITRDDVTDFVESQRTGKPVGRQDAAMGGSAAPAAARSTAAPAQPATTTPAAASGRAAIAPAPAAPAPAGGPARGAFAGPRVEFPDGADEVLVPTTQMRKGIAAQMSRALQVPHAYVAMEVDVTGLVRLRDREKAAYQAREGLSLSYVPFVVKAAAECLKRHPALNAHWTDQGLLAKRRINVGIAVAVDDGLIVPVVRDVDQLSISGLNKAIADVSARARAGHLRVDDFGGGTFTVDNTGWLGSNLTMPIINVPEVAILTMEDIRKRAVVVETSEGDVIAIRPVMNMVLAIDHRANDGAGATALLRDIKAWLEGVGPETPIY
ncbi:MAG TPA: dihydrolipoamide acetyltransferase family protein [Candidatus Binatus sp.]|nr:dihydrolipoamide acetyltransferase family protein [Candidatus Binatus sp.]